MHCFKRRSFRVLKVTAIHPRATDEKVRDILLRKFRGFGHVEVRLATDGGDRSAFVYFCSDNDASDAFEANFDIVFNELKAVVRPFYEEASTEFRPRSSRSRSPIRSFHSGGYFNNSERFLQFHSHAHPDFQHDRQNWRGRPAFHRTFNNFHFNGPRRFCGPFEEAAIATRTLFIGNLEENMNEHEIRKIFSKFGDIIEVNVKRSTGNNTIFAFVTLENVDVAISAKKEVAGQYFGRLQCKIGYGKSVPTSKIWIGGLGPWCTEGRLFNEFDRFGAVRLIDFHVGATSAHIVYVNEASAEAAVRAMRGFPLGGAENRIRVDFAGTLSSSNNYISESLMKPDGTICSLSGLLKDIPACWCGSLMLKTSLFWLQFHLIDGSADFVSIFNDDSGNKALKIKQRLRMAKIKTENLIGRFNDEGNVRSILICVASNSTVTDSIPDNSLQPIRNLIGYLKMKDSAGVMAIKFKNSENPGRILYLLPPCPFVYDLLLSRRENLRLKPKDEFVVLLVD